MQAKQQKGGQMTTKIGRRLEALRVERSLTQRQLGAKTGLSYSYISRVENGEREPSVKAIRRLAGALGVSPHFLETGDKHGLWVYITRPDLIEGAESGCHICQQIALENGVMFNEVVA
jgi:transcriptional regulator with XRE-family HTH domain